MESIWSKLEQTYQKQTPAYRKITQYLLSNPEEALYLSIVEIAEHSGVSQATVCRFCRDFGATSFSEFKLELAKDAKRFDSEETSPSNHGDSSKAHPFELSIERLYQGNIRAMRETIDRLNPATAQQAAQLMQKAKRIYFFGQGGSQIVALEAWARLMTISNKVFTVQDSHLQVIASSLLEKDDVIVYISYSGSTVEAESILQPAIERGAKIILITHQYSSTAGTFADLTLYCGSKEHPLQVGSISARIAMLFAIDILVCAYTQLEPELTEKNRERSVQALSKRHL